MWRRCASWLRSESRDCRRLSVAEAAGSYWGGSSSEVVEIEKEIGEERLHGFSSKSAWWSLRSSASSSERFKFVGRRSSVLEGRVCHKGESSPLLLNMYGLVRETPDIFAAYLLSG